MRQKSLVGFRLSTSLSISPNIVGAVLQKRKNLRSLRSIRAMSEITSILTLEDRSLIARTSGLLEGLAIRTGSKVAEKYANALWKMAKGAADHPREKF